MPASGVQFSINHNFTNNDLLLAYYDFSSGTGTNLDLGGAYYAAIRNQAPATNTGAYSGIILDSTAGSEAGAKTFATGTFITGSKGRLTKSNLQVNTPSLDYSSLTAIYDFEFDPASPVNDSILFGALEKTSSTINGEVVTGAKGYNFGINSRGKMFYQGFDSRGDYIQ